MIPTFEFPPDEDDAAVLVALLRARRDLGLAREAGWYRVPLASLPARFAADYLAFYQGAAFGPERFAVRYIAPVLGYRVAARRELLPQEPDHPRAAAPYYRVDLGPLAALPLAIPARRLRRVTFIPTSLGWLRQARDVAELFHPPAPPPEGIYGAGIAGQPLW